MKLSDHDLIQIDEKDLLELPEETLRPLSIKLLNDLKEARERLKQNSNNSSRPPSSDVPWKKAIENEEESGKDAEDEERPEKKLPVEEKSKALETDVPKEHQEKANTDAQASSESTQTKRKPGKQPGAPGFGRTQQLPVTAEEHHYPKVCNRCESKLNNSTATAYTGYSTIDVEWADEKHPGLYLTNTQHTLYENTCCCGHCTRYTPPRQQSHESTPTIDLSEWRLVGPGLAALIVCLALRMRLSRARIQEFLLDWLGLRLSVGTINATIHESGAAALPLENELIEAIQSSNLLHVDETTWKESGKLLWLWVFCTQQVVVYWIATRSAELIDNVLNDYLGWLMTDGYSVYRHFKNRFRCWSHLHRKAKGLKDSLNPKARQFGEQTLYVLDHLMAAIWEARKRPPDLSLATIYYPVLAAYWELCETMSSSTHEKACALAKEMLNDWEAIFQVLLYPAMPLTNNEAERALRHWVILRKISHGTRTEDGSRLLAILMSVVETCRVRQQSPWIYLATVIRLRRAGLSAPCLPNSKGSE